MKRFALFQLCGHISGRKGCLGSSLLTLVICQLTSNRCIFADATDPMSDGSRRSDLLIGGVIGGTAAAVVAAVIVIVIVRLCRQWRQYQKAVQSALGELQCHSPDGMAIALTSTARRDSLIGMCFSILFSFSSCLWCLLCRFSHHLNLITVYYSNGCVACNPSTLKMSRMFINWFDLPQFVSYFIC